MRQLKLCIAVVAFLVLHDVIDGKKVKKNRIKIEDEDTTPQPNVVAYSTFGFNDVSSYEGFVPSSPDYAKYLSGANQESATRIYPLAYPTSLDITGLGSNYDSQSSDGATFGVNDNTGPSGIIQYPQNPNFFNPANFESIDDQNKNSATDEIFGRQNNEELSQPVYGTKINLRNKNKPSNQFNYTEYNGFSSGPSDEKYFNPNEAQQPASENKPTAGEFYINNQNSNAPNYPPVEIDEYVKPSSGSNHNPLKFPKVIDFTKSIKFYPTALDTSKFATSASKPQNALNSITNDQSENIFANSFSDISSKYVNPTSSYKDTLDPKNNEKIIEKTALKTDSYGDSSYSFNYASASQVKPSITTGPKTTSEPKKKYKIKPSLGNSSSDIKKWKNPSPLKGYEYATNYSSMSFTYDVDKTRNPFISNNDEVVPASSNFESRFQYPETHYSSYKKTPEYKVHEEDEYSGYTSYKDTSKPNDFSNQYKDLFTTLPSISSNWGNVFKTSEYSSYKNHPKKHHFTDDISDDVINIPRRPSKLSYNKPLEKNPNEWSNYDNKPYKITKPWKDWNKEVSGNRFKSEEDLLGLRNHDTSHPSYLPTYKPNNNIYNEDNDYKNLVEKWRQSYLKSKYKDSNIRDYESYATEMKPFHVAVPKPYPIEVPHPVIVPVPQPYPVRVPIAKPVAVPVIREITVPIEKPVPYPVYKKVPYPVEKPVPVPVEKEVAVPVIKPYPVHVPYVRPVFHHTKPSLDDYEPDQGEDDDYMPRPNSSKKNIQYKRRPYGSRNRSRRPSRTVYQDRNRRRWPDRRRPSPQPDQRYRRPPPNVQSTAPHRYNDYEAEMYEEEHSGYLQYCKRTGNC